MYILSMSIKNVTLFPYNEWGYPERTKELRQVWQDPTDVANAFELLRKYNVKYVFFTSEQGYYDSTEKVYKTKPYSCIAYAIIFNRYLFMKTVFASGVTRIYEVHISPPTQ
jgi:uncharacterized membrane protein